MTRGMAVAPRSSIRDRVHPPSGSGVAVSRRALLAGAAALAIGARPTVGRAVGVTVEARLKQMTLPEKVAQLFVLPAWGAAMTPGYAAFLERVRPGAVLFVGANIGPVDTVAPFVAAIHATNPALAPLVSLDQEGGPVTRLPGDPTPGAVELGSLRDWRVRDAGRARAEFLRGFGIDVNFAPVADVAYAPDSFMADRAFGPDPATVARKVKALVRGANQTRLLSAAKHFPGHGRTDVDSHVALPVVDVSTIDWLASDALPFRAAVKAGVEVVMLGHLLYTQWDDVPASLSPVAVERLRTDLGFAGVVTTDDLGMDALAAYDPFDAARRALLAGVDQLLYVRLPADPEAVIAFLVDEVERGRIGVPRIDESVRRVLTLKLR